jgi:membrane protein required for colicin V production
MPIIIFDIILVVVLGGFALMGLVRGLIQTIGSILGFILGVLVASYYADDVANSLMPLLAQWAIAKTLAFFGLYWVVSHITAWLFYWLDQAYHLLSIIPFLGAINRIGGLILGVSIGVVISASLVLIITLIPWSLPLQDMVKQSQVAQLLLQLAHYVQLAVPGVFTQILNLIRS